MLAVAATSLLVAAWSPVAVPLLRPRLAVRGHAVMEARTMPSGLVYDEITAGTGDSPELEQMVKVRHRGVRVRRGTHTRSQQRCLCASWHLHPATHTQHPRQVHYTGTLSDGTVFDSSFSRGEPTEFKLSSVIPGWQEGLQMMKVGGKARLTIPPGLAYGDKQMNTIPPNSELTFEVAG